MVLQTTNRDELRNQLKRLVFDIQATVRELESLDRYLSGSDNATLLAVEMPRVNSGMQSAMNQLSANSGQLLGVLYPRITICQSESPSNVQSVSVGGKEMPVTSPLTQVSDLAVVKPARKREGKRSKNDALTPASKKSRSIKNTTTENLLSQSLPEEKDKSGGKC